jgi:DNA-binding response OmpR family regulator
MESILVISDDEALAETLSSELSGYRVAEARFKDAASLVDKEKFCLILTDEHPLRDTSELGNALVVSKIPLIKLARPIRLRELLYTIQNKLQSKTAPERTDLRLAAGFILSPSERLIVSDDTNIRVVLTEKEVEILACLMEQKNRIMPREKLLKTVWGYSDDIATHTLETHIYRLRGKLRQAKEAFDIVFLEDGGYRLVAEA